jgi:hypothetical protein
VCAIVVFKATILTARVQKGCHFVDLADSGLIGSHKQLAFSRSGAVIK